MLFSRRTDQNAHVWILLIHVGLQKILNRGTLFSCNLTKAREDTILLILRYPRSPGRCASGGRVSQQTMLKNTERQDIHAVIPGNIQNPVSLDAAIGKGIGKLYGMDRVNLNRSFQIPGRKLGQPDVADVTGIHTFFDRTDDLLYRNAFIHAGGLVQIHIVQPEPVQRVRQMRPHIPRLYVQPVNPSAEQGQYAELDGKKVTVK